MQEQNIAEKSHSHTQRDISMSCLNLGLPPAKKAWRSFTFKLQSKLRKFRNLKSKAIKKKPRTRLQSTTSSAKALINPTPFFGQRKKLRLGAGASLFKKKAAAPVYIDRLFKEAISAELVVKDPPSGKNVKILEQETTGPGTSNKEAKAGGSAADDMWESLALASPQMNGIDQRAEEFILRFRAEMEFQEMMARRNL